VAARPLRVGILGASSLVSRLAVAPAIESATTTTLAATASLSDPAATYRTYEALLADSDVEAVYIPLPNSMHREWTERAAAAGKHVLCEKPLAASAADAAAMAAACDAAGVVLMEAYMTQFHPRDRRWRELVADGALGEPLFARAAFTGVLGRPDDHRWHTEMGGGSLLDVGIYCVTPLLVALGGGARDAEAVTGASGAARRTERGVDASFSGWLEFGGGRAGSFECSFEAPERQQLEIVGTDGALSIDRACTPGPGDTAISLRHRDGSIETIEAGGADPYRSMVEHFAAVVRGSEVLERPATESVELARIVDRLGAAARRPAT
jgi:xylose dehydrogenase (NAD/NADP)